MSCYRCLMNISLTPLLEDYVKTKVDSGLYKSASEVIREGLRALRETEIDAKLKAGLAQVENGDTEPMNADFLNSIISAVEAKIHQR